MSPSGSEVSVVTVNWNGRDHLASLLPHLSKLACGEILVVDNASTDGSVDYVQQNFPAVRVIRNEVNRGFAQPCNLAARQAAGKYLAFINNDMRPAPRWIEAALAQLRDDRPCVACRILNWEGTRADFNGSSLQYLGYALQRDIGTLTRDLSHRNRVLFPCGGAMLIDRDVFLGLGGFDTDFFAIFEDVDLGWRIWLAGYEVAFAPDSIVYHRGHATFDTQPHPKMRYLMHRNALLTILKNYEEETFRRILPLAVTQAIKRAILFSGVEKDSFYLWARTQQRIRSGDSMAIDQLTDALNHLVAVDDVLETLPRTLAKRQRIQSTRKRTDAEMVQWFVDPLRPIVENPAYIEQELHYLELLHLDSLLDLSRYRHHLQGLPEALQERIGNLTRELQARRWLAGYVLSNPPPLPAPGVRQFLRVWRRDGFLSAWNRFLEHVDRGL